MLRLNIKISSEWTRNPVKRDETDQSFNERLTRIRMQTRLVILFKKKEIRNEQFEKFKREYFEVKA